MFRFICVLGLIALLTTPLFAQTMNIVEIDSGDTDALRNAIQEANDGPEDRQTIIKVSGDFAFTAEDSMPHIDAAITIRGPARFRGPGVSDASLSGDQEGPEQLFHINSGASFWLDNLELANFSLNHESNGLIVNEGELVLKQMQLSSVYTERWCIKWCTPAMAVIVNRPAGQLVVRQVSFVNSGIYGAWAPSNSGVIVNQGHAAITSTQIYSTEHAWRPPLSNDGTLDIYNSSFVFNDASFSHTVISGFSDSVCRDASSVGYNLHDSPDCAWSSTGDLIGIPAGLIWRPVETRWDWAGQQLLTHALVPMAASPVVDSGNSDWCITYDLLGQERPTDGDGQKECDRGAVESWWIGLAEGGINGLYFNPEADGHYLYVLETDFTTLVVWTTFDADGNQAWVYGTGELIDGRSVIADTYINRNGGYSIDGEIVESESERWGRLEVDMTSCTAGLVAFYSDLPKFGRGQFPIERLAYVKQLGCVD
jgi:hypothetical protein